MYFSRVRVKQNIRELSFLQHLLRDNGYGAHQLLWDLFPSKDERYLFREEIASEQMSYLSGVRSEPIYYVVSHYQPANNTPLFAVESKLYEPKIEVGDRLSFKLRANPVRLAKKERPAEAINAWLKKRVERGLREKVVTKMRIRHDVVMDSQNQVLCGLSERLKVDHMDGKAAWKEVVFNAWRSSGDQSVTAALEKYLEGNERYIGFLDERLGPAKLFDLGFKAAMDTSLEKWLVEKGEKKGFKLARDSKRNRLQFQTEGYRWHALPKKGRNAGFSSVDFDGVIEVTDPEMFVAKCLFEGIGPEKGFGCGLMLVRRIRGHDEWQL